MQNEPWRTDGDIKIKISLGLDINLISAKGGWIVNTFSEYRHYEMAVGTIDDQKWKINYVYSVAKVLATSITFPERDQNEKFHLKYRKVRIE